MTDWTIWQKGYTDCMAGPSEIPPEHRHSQSYQDGWICAVKVKEALKC
jgi:hypothetical protein